MRYAICNETFEGWEHARVCDFVAACGYAGLEVAPFTLAPRITDVTAQQRREVRRVAELSGLQIPGLHWLLARTEGFLLTSPDPAVRRASGEYLGELARAARDLGGNLLILGSPVQRRIPEGVTPQQAEDNFVASLEVCLPVLEETGVELLLEPLAPAEADFMQTAAHAMRIRQRLNHPRVQLHLDVKAMSSESIPIPELIATHAHALRHFHANDANRRGPGFGEVDFVPILAALQKVHYAGWVSVEVFDYTPDPQTIATRSIEYLRRCEPAR